MSARPRARSLPGPPKSGFRGCRRVDLKGAPCLKMFDGVQAGAEAGDLRQIRQNREAPSMNSGRDARRLGTNRRASIVFPPSAPPAWRRSPLNGRAPSNDSQQDPLKPETDRQNRTMPELPEIETFRAVLSPQLCGRTITHPEIRHPAVVAHPSAEAFVDGVSGRAVQGIDRRGKFLILRLDRGADLVAHLRMTGRLLVTPGDYPAWPHTHAVLRLSDGNELRFVDPRRFGRLWLRRPGDIDTFTGISRLGLEPLEPTLDAAFLQARFGKRRAAIKTCLLDQAIVAGIGNIYADEILFAARIRPTRASATLGNAEWRRLAEAIPAILRKAIKDNRTSPEEFLAGGGTEYRNTPLLLIYGHAGDPCPSCATKLTGITIGGRGSCFCPTCQR